MAINAISGLTLNFRNSVEGAEKASAKDMLRMSTGLRINSAADDAAGLAISTRMNAQSRGMAMAIRNANDLLSLTQTAEGAAKDITDALQRMRELSVQAANGTLTAADRTSINEEVTQLKQHIDAVSKQTKFNNINLLDGSIKNASFQIGGNTQDTLKLSMPALDTNSLAQTPVTNKYKLTFTALAAGQSVTVAGLTFKATADTSAGDVAAAFSNMVENATTGAGTATGEYSGAFTGFSSGKTDGTVLELTTTASNMKGEAPKVAVAQLPVVPTINTYSVSFSSLIAGQSVTVAGLTFKANGDTTASTIAAAFAAGSSNSGTLTGAFQGFNACGTTNGQLNLVSTSGNPQGVAPVISVQAGAAPQIPQVTITQGVQAAAAIPGKTSLTFVNIKNLSQGDWIELGGLKFVCTKTMEPQSWYWGGSWQVQDNYIATNVFSGLTPNSPQPPLTNNWNGINLASYGYFEGQLTGWDGTQQGATIAHDGTTALAFITQESSYVGSQQTVAGAVVALVSTQRFSSTPSLQISASSNGLISIVHEQQGAPAVPAVAPITETANITFSPITNGQSVTIAGLTFTASQDLTALQVASAFSPLGEGDNANSVGLNYGTYSGQLIGYRCNNASGAEVQMISTTVSSDVTDISVTTGVARAPVAPRAALTSSSSPISASEPNVTKEVSAAHELPHSLNAITVATEQDASDAIQVIDKGIKEVTKFETEIGAVQNRVESVINNLTTANTNLKASLSRIDDADYAVETSNMAKHQIISQAAMAMLAQANQSTATVESLLKQFK